MDKCKGVLQDKQEEVSVRTGPITHSRRRLQSYAQPSAPRNSTLLHQCLFPPWQTVFQNHHQVSKNKNAVAYMLPFIQWPKWQESIRDVKYFPWNTDPYWLCIYTHVFKTAVSTIGMRIFSYSPPHFWKELFFPHNSLLQSNTVRVATGRNWFKWHLTTLHCFSLALQYPERLPLQRTGTPRAGIYLRGTDCQSLLMRGGTATDKNKRM